MRLIECDICQERFPNLSEANDHIAKCHPEQLATAEVHYVDLKPIETGMPKKISTDISAPTYYTHGKIETWDFIIDKGMNFLEGNIIKYVTRWRGKNGVEDLKKARVYLDKLIEEAEKE